MLTWDKFSNMVTKVIEKLPLLFEENFLEHHAGQIIQDPRFAIIELLANSWDAGATKVEIRYPDSAGDYFLIKDNGSGMTTEEFKFCWNNLNYNRLKHQGKEVRFPKGSANRNRLVFGKNGVGRHAMFCFCEKSKVAFFFKQWGGVNKKKSGRELKEKLTAKCPL